MLSQFLQWLQSHFNFLVLFGLVGQALFMMRFVAQWFASEKAKRSVMPEVFWYFSFGGGLVLLIYALIRQDPVFILGQGTGLFIYTRNIIFIWKARRQRRATTHDEALDRLAQKTADLATRHKNGGISHAERRAAHEALQVLENVEKGGE